MRHLLSSRGLADLRRFASSDVLVGFDFDGTLAPIVADPAKAYLTATVRKQLVQVTGRYPCVVISGRGRSDLRARVAGVGFRAAIGNHGAEPSSRSKRFRALLRDWRLELGALLGSEPGVAIEDKEFSLSVHYRGARDKTAARRRIRAAVAGLRAARIISGKQVVNVVPRDAANKGVALRTQCDKLRCRLAIYVGDDETDEDVFRMGAHGNLLAIRVGYSKTSRATHYLKNQKAVSRFLEHLSTFRPRQ